MEEEYSESYTLFYEVSGGIRYDILGSIATADCKLCGLGDERRDNWGQAEGIPRVPSDMRYFWDIVTILPTNSNGKSKLLLGDQVLDYTVSKLVGKLSSTYVALDIVVSVTQDTNVYVYATDIAYNSIVEFKLRPSLVDINKGWVRRVLEDELDEYAFWGELICDVVSVKYL